MYLAEFVPSISNSDVVSAGIEDVADTQRNAIIAPSQQAPKHSEVLIPNSFQRILSAPRKFLTKARRRASVINQAVEQKTNLFSVKQPSTRNDKKSVACSYERRKGRKLPPQESK